MVKRSIFKQQIFAKRYKVARKEVLPFSYHSLCDTQLFYTVNESGSKLIKEDEIFVCDLEMPMLQIEEKFYIEEKEMLVTIKSRYRTSKENVVYYIESKLVEDEYTLISKTTEENKLMDVDNRIEALSSSLSKACADIERKNRIIKQYQNSFWSRFIKTTIPNNA